jgi:hypothetical protein
MSGGSSTDVSAGFYVMNGQNFNIGFDTTVKAYVTPSGNLVTTGSVKLGDDTRTASAAGAGTIRWNGGVLQNSDGTDWIDVGKVPGYRYTRYYVVSATVAHHPRISRIYLIDANGSKMQVYYSTSDNCSDQGAIPSNGNSFTHDAGSGNANQFTGFGFYSVYSGGNRGSNIKIEGSDDNSSWTQIGSTIDAQSAASCGEKDFYV